MNRPLSDLEHAIWVLDQAVSQNFVMVAHISGVLSESVLKQALNLAQKKYPPLQSRILAGKVPMFTSVGVLEIPLRIETQKNEYHWITEAEREIALPFAWENGPLVRVVQLVSQNKCDLLFTFCHITADATSGVVFVKNLLMIADVLIKGETIKPTSLPVRPSSVDLFSSDVLKKLDLSNLTDNADKQSFLPVKLEEDQAAPLEKRGTRIIQRILSHKETKVFLNKCKLENTSVHGALCAALMQAFVEEIRGAQDVPNTGALMIGCCTPVSIRQHFSVSVEGEIGDFIADALHYQPIDEKSTLWDAARATKKSLQKIIDEREDVRAILGVGDLLKSHPSPLDLLKAVNGAFPHVVASNLAKLQIDEKFGALILENLHFSLSINPVARNGFGISVVSFRERITINFLYLSPVISKMRANNMVDNTMNRLKDTIRLN